MNRRAEILVYQCFVWNMAAHCAVMNRTRSFSVTFPASVLWMSLCPGMVQSSVAMFCLVLVNGEPDTVHTRAQGEYIPCQLCPGLPKYTRSSPSLPPLPLLLFTQHFALRPFDSYCLIISRGKSTWTPSSHPPPSLLALGVEPGVSKCLLQILEAASAWSKSTGTHFVSESTRTRSV